MAEEPLWLLQLMNVNAYVAKRFPLIEPIYTAKSIVRWVPPALYSSILILYLLYWSNSSYVILLWTLFVKPIPPPDSTHFGTAAHMYVVMSLHHIMVTLSPITEYSGDCVKSEIGNAC